MTTDDLEQLLQRYRPVAPPASLRTALMTARRATAVPLQWIDVALISAAAAVIVIAMLTRAPAAGPTLQEAERTEVVNEVASALGGGDAAVRTAEMMVPQVGRPAPLVREEQP